MFLLRFAVARTHLDTVSCKRRPREPLRRAIPSEATGVSRSSADHQVYLSPLRLRREHVQLHPSFMRLKPGGGGDRRTAESDVDVTGGLIRALFRGGVSRSARAETAFKPGGRVLLGGARAWPSENADGGREGGGGARWYSRCMTGWLTAD